MKDDDDEDFKPVSINQLVIYMQYLASTSSLRVSILSSLHIKDTVE